MHTAIDSHTAPLCSSETTQVCLRNTLIRQTQSTIRFVFSHGAEHTPCIHLPALNVCGKKITTTRARQYRFCIRFTGIPRNHTRSLQSAGEKAMQMHMCGVFERKLPRLCSVGYAQTVSGVFTPGITLQRTSVSSVGHSYPYPGLLEVMYDIHTCTRNFWKFCTPVATIPGVPVQHVLYPLGTSVSSVRLCHNTRNFWKFCKTSVPVPGTSGSYVRSSYPYPVCDSCKAVAQYPGYGYNFVTIPGELCIHSGSIRKVYYALIRMSCFVSHTNRSPNTASSTYHTIRSPTCC